MKIPMTSCLLASFEAASEFPQKSSANVVNVRKSSKKARNVRMAFGQHSDNCKKLLSRKEVARKMKSCPKVDAFWIISTLAIINWRIFLCFNIQIKGTRLSWYGCIQATKMPLFSPREEGENGQRNDKE